MTTPSGGIHSPGDPDGQAPGPGYSTGVPEALPEGELFVVGGPLLLAEDAVEAVPVATYQLESAGEQLLVKCRFAGRWNRSDERATTEVALHPEQAMELVDQLLSAMSVCALRAKRGRRQ
ncbi:hypothetical protein [Blastococcus xanthinilyticus]|uniref:Uncharacterized protein n=1 Tax=Blastococcus xanthinilyticus TaxID=1564164 RepID=A0A5S5CM94_9ACTN|nr:hypothetical protein [Blastococcus xanthinilyticus]TYP82042.1 hypothetical protein BD833_12026 [Blastococcus xanthinilyticus]